MDISSIVLKIPETATDYSCYCPYYSCYCPLSLLILIIENEFIDYVGLNEGTRFYAIYSLEDVNGQTIKIADLKCKTFAEFVVAIDVNNLNHNVN